MSDTTFKLYACCIPVRGARRSTVCDLQRQTYRFIPNALYEILTVHRDRTVSEVKAAYGHGGDAEIDAYFRFLIEQDFGFWCDAPESFPRLDLTWDAPEVISNGIIDIGPGSTHDFRTLFAQFDDLGCKALQLRFFCEYPLSALRSVICLTDRGRLRSVELILRYGPDYGEVAMRELLRDHPRISGIVVHAAPFSQVIRPGGPATIAYSTQQVNSEAHCGQVHPAYFAPRLGVVAEAQAYNTCLNRKLSVDQHGDIRNCPSLPTSFGNAARTALRDAAQRQEFRRLWTINKDQIETCKDCEFRYICTDCRAYVRVVGDLYSKPAKCAYDPYTAQWGVGDTREAAGPVPPGAGE